jgi:hypothetical protein
MSGQLIAASPEPGDLGLITRAAWAELENADCWAWPVAGDGPAMPCPSSGAPGLRRHADLQLVESIRAPGRSESANGGHHQPSAAAHGTEPARLTRRGGQTRLTIGHPHAEPAWVEAACRYIAAFFKTLRRTAEQLTLLHRWYPLLSRALPKYLNGRQLQPPAALPAPA